MLPGRPDQRDIAGQVLTTRRWKAQIKVSGFNGCDQNSFYLSELKMYFEMSDRLENLEKAITELNPVELKEFASWFMDYDQTIWEREIEEDAKSGRLDFLRDEAHTERKSGKLKDL